MELTKWLNSTASAVEYIDSYEELTEELGDFNAAMLTAQMGYPSRLFSTAKNRVEERASTLLNMVQAVVDLHSPDDRNECPTCYGFQSPCPTIQIMDRARQLPPSRGGGLR